MVLYRKYRPQSLDDLIGQETVKQSLLSAFKSDKLAHAYIFCGPRGTGKTSTARILAKMVNCNDKKIPCNRCEICLSITDGTNLDLIEIDAASNRGIDDIRSLRETIKLSPTSARKKVYIIDEVHMLTTEAFNALLKTLEEPPSHVLFILATTDVGKVPPTVLSRTTRLDFKSATLIQLLEALKKIAQAASIKIGDDSLLLIAKVAAGSFRDGVKMLDQVAVLEEINPHAVEQILGSSHFDNLVHLMDLIAQFNRADAIKALIDNLEKWVSVKELNLGILDILRQVLLIKNNLGKLVSDELDEEKYKILAKLADKLSLDRVVSSIDIFQKSLESSRFVSIPSLPLEVAVMESCMGLKNQNPQIKNQMKSEVSESQRVSIAEKSDILDNRSFDTPSIPDILNSDIQKIKEKWAYILETIRPYNYSLEALLRSANIKECDKKMVILEVPYSFHQRILEAPKSKELLESIFSDVLSRPIKISISLGQRPQKVEDVVLEVVQDDEVVRIAAEIFNSDTVN